MARRWTARFGVPVAIVGCGLLVAALGVVWSERTTAGSNGASVSSPGTSPGVLLTPGGSLAPTVRPSPTAGLSPGAHTTASGHASTPPSTKSSPKPAAGERSVTFVNAVHETIWVAAYQQTPKPALKTTGWVLPTGQTLTISVPDKWNGRFWGRTGCSFDGSGRGHCVTGDCAGRFQCRQYGAIPATLAEYNLNAWDGLDFYDVSLVDGSNLPMYINITKGKTKDKISSKGCSAAGCVTAVDCPAVLRVAGAACISACAHFNTDDYCCRGTWAPRSVCVPSRWPVNYAAVFKKAEPFAYSYAYDDATSTFTCTGGCDYRIIFGLSG